MGTQRAGQPLLYPRGAVAHSIREKGNIARYDRCIPALD